MREYVPVRHFPADWDRHRKAAGHIRNEQMAQHGTHLLAFHIQGSAGTKSMLDKMVAAKKPYWRFDERDVARMNQRLQAQTTQSTESFSGGDFTPQI